eukprot:COSAG02_NODE_52696_length_306_cov_0.753623_1_plen_39_part_10
MSTQDHFGHCLAALQTSSLPAERCEEEMQHLVSRVVGRK